VLLGNYLYYLLGWRVCKPRKSQWRIIKLVSFHESLKNGQLISEKEEEEKKK
jgi:hypothetical protein